jgi:2-phospho-L-lactate guanylyltransferase
VNCWAIIPVKADKGKMRLAGVLDEGARQRLVRVMLDAVVAAASEARTIGRTCIVGPSRHGLAEAIPLLGDPGAGLNPALSAALATALEGGAERAVIVAADLPQVTSRDLELLSAAPDHAVAIAPDRHGTGTNALSLPLPAAAEFTFAFGPDSFALHDTEARRLGLAVEIIESNGLMRDIDEPADLPDAAGLLGE